MSELSKSFWSAEISIKLDFESTHERVKHLIPELDLTNLPLDSDDDNKSTNQMDAVESGGFHEVDLGANAAKMFHNTTQGLVFNRSHQMGNFN